MFKNNTFYILRHGETEYQGNKNHLTYPFEKSVDSIGLTKRGEEQIKQLIPKIKELKIHLIYSSDFLRTRQTSMIVARGIGLKEGNIIFNSRLRDINIGTYHDGPREEFNKIRKRFLGEFDFRTPKGESLKDAVTRMLDFVKEIDKKHKDKNILIVSHGEPLWLLDNFTKNLTKEDLINENFVKQNYIQTGELRKLN